jgi:plastocyanin
MMRLVTWSLLACSIGLGGVGPPRSTTHTVVIEDMRFQPEVLTVAAGETVVWVNKDLVPHTATSKAGRFDSKTILAGASWTYTVRGTGDIDYRCTFHPTMTAVLQVTR